jgi:hypothetical protein
LEGDTDQLHPSILDPAPDAVLTFFGGTKEDHNIDTP